MLELLALTAVAATAPAQDSLSAPKIITLEQALQIALSENASVKVADMEIKRAGYARKGSYAALFPSLDGSASYQRTIKKQVMYMDGGGFNIAGMMGEYLLPLYAQHPDIQFPVSQDSEQSSSGGGIEVGRWNTWSTGITSTLPLVNAQLWKSLKISDEDVELAVEKARSSRLEMVTQVKQAYFSCLLARDAFNVYRSVYENALENLNQTQRKYNAQKASDLDMARAKANLASAIPNVYDAENSIIVSLWQLKAVMGVDLDENIDIAGNLADFGESMLYDREAAGAGDLSGNSTMRQLEIQARQLADAIKVQQYANIPSLALAFSYNINAMTNDFNFSEYQWSPYSYVGVSLSIPIFAGGKRANAIRQAKVQSAELDVQKKNTERQLQIALRQYLNTMEASINSYGAAQSAVEAASKAYDIASRSYSLGRSTLTDLNDAQLVLTQSQLSVSQAIFNFVTAKANLEQTLGYDFTE